MWGLIGAALALFGLYKLASEKDLYSKLAEAPVVWPQQQGMNLGAGRHYFWTVPVTNPNAQLLQSAITAMGWSGVQVFPPGQSTRGAPLPNPPQWKGSSQTRVVGTWNGDQGAPLNVDALKPLGLDTTAKPVLFISTEEWVTTNTAKA